MATTLKSPKPCDFGSEALNAFCTFLDQKVPFTVGVVHGMLRLSCAYTDQVGVATPSPVGTVDWLLKASEMWEQMTPEQRDRVITLRRELALHDGVDPTEMVGCLTLLAYMIQVGFALSRHPQRGGTDLVLVLLRPRLVNGWALETQWVQVRHYNAGGMMVLRNPHSLETFNTLLGVLLKTPLL